MWVEIPDEDIKRTTKYAAEPSEFKRSIDGILLIL